MFLRYFKLVSWLTLVALTGCGGGGESKKPQVQTLKISGSPVTKINEDQYFDFQTIASGGSGGYRFQLLNNPAWLNITQDGRVFGMATTDSDAGLYENISVQVTDSNGKVASLPNFNIEVIAVNDLPEVIFDKTEVQVDARGSFTVAFEVIDEEGDAFEFALQDSNDNLSLALIDQQIEGTASDLQSVTNAVVSIVVTSNGQTRNARLPVTIYPLTSSGLGRTLVGSKEGPGVHLVILGEGYREEEQERYNLDANLFIEELKLDPGISEHVASWNLHVVKTVSQESGADAVFGEDTVNTFFDAGYFCNDIERLLCLNNDKVFEVVFNEYPHFDQAVIVVNSAKYGGAGGQFATFARTAPEIALHEIGHSFAGLGDEYVDESIASSRAPYYQEGRYANVSNIADSTQVPWSHWIENHNNFPTAEGESGIGMFEGSYYHATGFYRPLSNSRMRSNNADFGEINSEQFIISSYLKGGVIKNISPQGYAFEIDSAESITFAVDTIFDEAIQGVTWKVNGVIQNEATNQRVFEFSAQPGSYGITVDVTDISGKIKKVYSFANYRRAFEVTVN